MRTGVRDPLSKGTHTLSAPRGPPSARPGLSQRHPKGSLTHGRVPSWDPGGPLFQQRYPSRIGFRVLSGRALVLKSPHGGRRPAYRSEARSLLGAGPGGTAMVTCVLTMAEGASWPYRRQPAGCPAGTLWRWPLAVTPRSPGRVGAPVTGRPPRCVSARSWQLCLEGLILLSAEI